MLDFFFFFLNSSISLYYDEKRGGRMDRLAETSQPLLKYRKADDSIYRSCMFSCISRFEELGYLLFIFYLREKVIFIY